MGDGRERPFQERNTFLQRLEVGAEASVSKEMQGCGLTGAKAMGAEAE